MLLGKRSRTGPVRPRAIDTRDGHSADELPKLLQGPTCIDKTQAFMIGKLYPRFKNRKK